MSLLPVGSEAPDFEAKDQRGEVVRLRDLRGKPVVLWFYPADETPGCTAEACGFRDDHAAWQRAGAAVLGVSTQGVASHARFAERHRLPFRLVADPDKAVGRAYKALNLLGYARRVTYLIGPDGRIARTWDHVSPAGHSREVLEAVAAAVPAGADGSTQA